MLISIHNAVLIALIQFSLFKKGLYALEKNESDPKKASVEFVLAVLRQHEIEFERIIAQLEILVDTVNEVAEKLQQKMQNDYT